MGRLLCHQSSGGFMGLLSLSLVSFRQKRRHHRLPRQDREGILIRQHVEQVIDILNDALGANGYSRQIRADFNRGFRKYPPSAHSVRSILWTIRAARRHIEQNRMLLNQ